MNDPEKSTILEAENLAYHRWFDRYFKFIRDILAGLYKVDDRTMEVLQEEESTAKNIRNKYDLMLKRKNKEEPLPPSKN